MDEIKKPRILDVDIVLAESEVNLSEPSPYSKESQKKLVLTWIPKPDDYPLQEQGATEDSASISFSCNRGAWFFLMLVLEDSSDKTSGSRHTLEEAVPFAVSKLVERINKIWHIQYRTALANCKDVRETESALNTVREMITDAADRVANRN